jgi:hypothetical protein
MTSLAKYFSENREKPKFIIGDYVTGKLNGIRFMGTVGNDRVVSEEQGAMVSVHLFLPLLIEGTYRSLVNVPQGDVKLLKKF